MNDYKIYKGTTIVAGEVIAPLIIIDSTCLNVGTEEVAGKIAVIRTATPAVVLWLRKATGLVIERGGVASHGAILAREFNIPCIVGVPGVYDSGINGLLGSLQSDLGVLKVWQ